MRAAGPAPFQASPLGRLLPAPGQCLSEKLPFMEGIQHSRTSGNEGGRKEVRKSNQGGLSLGRGWACPQLFWDMGNPGFLPGAASKFQAWLFTCSRYEHLRTSRNVHTSLYFSLCHSPVSLFLELSPQHIISLCGSAGGSVHPAVSEVVGTPLSLPEL